jgi:hypothetical protein
MNIDRHGGRGGGGGESWGWLIMQRRYLWLLKSMLLCCPGRFENPNLRAVARFHPWVEGTIPMLLVRKSVYETTLDLQEKFTPPSEHSSP